jgi:phosphatidylglycerophosphate synthase
MTKRWQWMRIDSAYRPRISPHFSSRGRQTYVTELADGAAAISLQATLHAILLLSENLLSPSDEPAFLGLPIGLRVALALVDAGATELSVHGPHAAAVCELWRRDERLQVPLHVHSGTVPIDLVCRDDAWIAPERVRGLAWGHALADQRGEPVIARVRPTCTDDPAQLLQAAEVLDAAHVLRLRRAEEREVAHRALFASLIKASDGPVSRHFNRHISRTITRLVIPLGMTPNAMTVCVAICGLLAAYAASFPSPALQLLGAALYQLHSIIDGCDGEIARVTHRFGKHGALIDSLVDDLCNGAFFLGLSLGVARSLGATWPIATGALTALTYAAVIGLQYQLVLRATGQGDKTKFWAASRESRASVFGVFKALLRRDVFVLLILIAVSLQLTEIMVALFPLCALGGLIASAMRALASKRPA